MEFPNKFTGLVPNEFAGLVAGLVAVLVTGLVVCFCWIGVGKGGNFGTAILLSAGLENVEPIGSTICPKGSVRPFCTTINRSVLLVG